MTANRASPMECLARAIIRRSARSGYAQHRVPAPRRKHRNADGWRQLREVGAYAIELPQARQGRIVRTSATAGVVGTIPERVAARLNPFGWRDAGQEGFPAV